MPKGWICLQIKYLNMGITLTGNTCGWSQYPTSGREDWDAAVDRRKLRVRTTASASLYIIPVGAPVQPAFPPQQVAVETFKLNAELIFKWAVCKYEWSIVSYCQNNNNICIGPSSCLPLEEDSLWGFQRLSWLVLLNNQRFRLNGWPDTQRTIKPYG